MVNDLLELFLLWCSGSMHFTALTIPCKVEGSRLLWRRPVLTVFLPAEVKDLVVSFRALGLEDSLRPLACYPASWRR